MMNSSFLSARQLGAVLRSARTGQGLSQTELAERAGVDRPWLVRLETGRLDNPTLRLVLQVVDALGLQLSVEEPADRGNLTNLDDLLSDEGNGR